MVYKPYVRATHKFSIDSKITYFTSKVSILLIYPNMYTLLIIINTHTRYNLRVMHKYICICSNVFARKMGGADNLKYTTQNFVLYLTYVYIADLSNANAYMWKQIRQKSHKIY